MPKKEFAKGTVNQTEKIFLQDSSKTDQSGLVGLVAPASNLNPPVPSAFTTSSTGGTLAPGTYYFRLTSTNALGESLPSAEVSIVVPAGTNTNSITANWATAATATGYKLYGRLQNGELFIVAVGAVTTYTDTGSITPSGVIPTLSAVGLVCYYIRQNASASVAVPLVNSVLGTYQSGGFVAVPNMPGVYELGIPNAAIAAGANSVVLEIYGATNLSPYPMEIQLDATDNQNAVNGGMTSLPNAAAGSAGGLDTPIAAAGLAQAGGANTITLAAGAIATDNYYRGATVEIFSGTGAGQARIITSYVGATKVATLGRNWAVQPDNTSVYAVRAEVGAAVNDSLQVVASTVAGAVTTDVSATVGTIATGVTEIAGDTDTIITNQGSQATATALATAQTGITEIAGDTDALMAGVAATATPANVATALANSGVTAARMQLLDAAVGTWSRSGNVITMHTVDNAHVFTATFDDITNPLTCTVVQVS
ncbi:MAG: 15, gp15 [Chloroflexi bacterium]|nr:15, gp15 [Chloroflexota bacterium]